MSCYGRMMFLLVFFFIVKNHIAYAQTSPSEDAAQIKLQLNKLNVLGSVLYIAAHPDDENTRLIAYLASEKLYRTGYLSLTRGDGGQNLVGNEQGELLGLVRTQELLAARKIDGAQQFFTRAYDFGYTKSAEETFSFWNKDSILSDVVYVIRYFQPDVIICRFSTKGENDHGQHTASAILASEAFTAAADPTRFPEQLKYVSVWQAKRLLRNLFSSEVTSSEGLLKVDIGTYNPLLGKGYAEIAAESRSMHKSQGFGSAKTRGSQMEYFKILQGDTVAHELTDGINMSWNRLSGGETIQGLVSDIIQNYQSDNPSASVVSLINLYSNIINLSNSSWKMQKRSEVEQLIQECCGLWFEAYAVKPSIAPGRQMEMKIQAINRSNIPVTLKSFRVQEFDSTVNAQLPNNQLISLQHSQSLAPYTEITQPYWLQKSHGPEGYHIDDKRMLSKAENDPAVNVKAVFSIDGKDIFISRPLVYKYVDPVKGEIYRPLEVVPPVTVNIEEPLCIFHSNQSQEVKVHIKSAIDNAKGFVSLRITGEWRVTPSSEVGELKNEGDEMTLSFSIEPRSSSVSMTVDTIRAYVELNGQTYDRGIVTIAYDYIPTITLFPHAESKLVSVPLQMKGRNIGYLPGAGDMIPEMLKQIGYHLTMLSDNDLENGNLQQYDAIIGGVRLYNTDKNLKVQNEKLLNYVSDGGCLVIQYNTANNLIADHIGPYPFKISRDRVTDEHSKVTFLKPDAPVLNTPNKITQADFEGWIQERGLYFVAEADTAYQKILAMSDKGESSLDGSLIVCNYGKGKYVYTSLSFFRQLPAGVPGAFRLFVNLISK